MDRNAWRALTVGRCGPKPMPMPDNSTFRYSPATPDDAFIVGACRPGYPGRAVPMALVREWVEFMRGEQVMRVVCLLAENQLAFYGDLLGVVWD